jgi:hypothetical protein
MKEIKRESSVFEKNFKIDLRLSAFGQMFTCILYCPNIAKCPWLLQMIPIKISHPKLTSHGMQSCVECFMLLHSPIIIDIKKLQTIQETVADDEIDNVMNTCEMCDFFSSTH